MGIFLNVAIARVGDLEKSHSLLDFRSSDVVDSISIVLHTVTADTRALEVCIIRDCFTKMLASFIVELK